MKRSIRRRIFLGVVLSTVITLGLSRRAVANILDNVLKQMYQTYAVLTITTGAGAIENGMEWKPSLKLISKPGMTIVGPLAFVNNSGRGPGTQEINCIGLGTGGQFNGGCDIETYSSDGDGQIWLTATEGALAHGLVTVDFSQNWPGQAICTLTLVDLDASWATGATAKIVGDPCMASGHSCPQKSMTVAWNNVGIPLEDGHGHAPMYGINWHCLALP